VGREVRRVATERLDEAIEMLERLDQANAAEIEDAVHDTRKRCKEVRALARLVRPALGGEFDRFNTLVRDAADALAPIRDAHAVLATLDDLRATQPGSSADLDHVRAAQFELAEGATKGVHAGDERIAEARTLLVTARRRVKRWKVASDFSAVRDGLEATYRRGRRALRRAEARPDDESLHEWRKSVKNLGYQIRLLGGAAPSVLESLEGHLDDLAEALGDDHDLAVLVERLLGEPGAFGGTLNAMHAVDVARRQQDDLRRRAFRLGATVYAERPERFTARMERYWEIADDRGPELPTGGITELAEDERRAAAARRRDSDRTVERERKYLVTSPPDLPPAGTDVRQGYLAIDGVVSVRVREAADEGCTLTIKAGRGKARTELEWSITDDQFASAWEQTRGRRIRKTRYRLPVDGHEIELDVFHDDLSGLVLAEVEFDSDEAMELFQSPSWFAREVTDELAFTNASLAANAPVGQPAA
jgi:CYTH domain-containing protein/CHAD domain-containing protein